MMDDKDRGVSKGPDSPGISPEAGDAAPESKKADLVSLARWMSGSGEARLWPAELLARLAGALREPDSLFPEGGMCGQVCEILPEIMEAGTSEARPPEVEAHLESCPGCRSHEAFLKEVMAEKKEWAELSGKMAKAAEQGSMLAFLKGAWRWIGGLLPHGGNSEAERFSLGPWTGRMLAPTLAFGGESGETRALTIETKLEDGSVVELSIAPERSSVSGRANWRFAFTRKEEGPEGLNLWVEVVDGAGRSQGKLSVPGASSVEFSLPPAGPESPYSVLFSHVSETGEWKETVLPLPFVSQEGET